MSQRWPFLIPFVFISSGLSLSVLGGYYCSLTAVIAAFLCFTLLSFLPFPRLYILSNAAFFLLWGLFALQPWLTPEASDSTIKSKVSESPRIIEGVITERPSISPDGSRLVIKVERLPDTEGGGEVATGSMLVYVSNGDVKLNRGDRIRFVSRISVPRKLGLPGEFDYSRYLAFQGISATGRVASQADIVLIRAAVVETWQRTIDLTAHNLGDAVRFAIPDDRVSSVITALLLGDQRRIPQDLADAYTRAGVNHILSISGFHVGIIAAFIILLVIWTLTRFEYFALHWNIRRFAVLASVPIMISYLFLTGNAPATARSVIMLTVFAVSLFSERERDSINTLLLAAFFLVAINPPTLFDISFQLSFLSLWGILIAVPLIMKKTEWVKSVWMRSFFQFIAASVAASSVTLIPVLYTFKVASLNGILTNFLIVPLLGYGAVLTGFIALPFVVMFPSFASILLWPTAALVKVSNQFILWCTSLPVFTFHGVTAWDMLFFLLLMVCFTFIKSRPIQRISAVLIPVIALVIHIYSSACNDGRLHITMLSVGQAESILLKLPDGSTMLVDGGGYLHDTGHDFGQRILAPALGALNVSRINRMIATHEHPDHSGGLPYVIKNFPVEEFISGTTVTSEIQSQLDSKKIPYRAIAAGDEITLPGSVNLKVLSPQKAASPGQSNEELNVNENSLVFRLSYGSFSMLFCADAGFEAEQQMLERKDELQSTALKVGHHGSRYSTSDVFLNRVSPEVALISAGAGNRFGLPAPRTIELFKSKQIPVYRTDYDGTIELVTDGIKWAVTTPYKP